MRNKLHIGFAQLLQRKVTSLQMWRHTTLVTFASEKGENGIFTLNDSFFFI